MDSFSFENEYNNDVILINNELNTILEKYDNDNIVTQAMKYAIENGGKRMRPVLTLEFCKACGRPVKDALPFACSLEFIHSASLIQDDLPSMDNAPLRRGKPACHVVYGESIALLASDALSLLAIESILSFSKVSKIISHKAANELIGAIGVDGLIGGQALDVLNNGSDIQIDEVTNIYSMKTEILFSAAAKLGCIAGRSSKKELNAAMKYAKNIGLAYQIVDDILDITTDEQTLGKSPYKDIENKKITYPSVLGIDKSRKLVSELTKEAQKHLKDFDLEKAQFLREFATRLEQRQY